jgi:basic amino acid/polyamine antiporter, APA family
MTTLQRRLGYRDAVVIGLGSMIGAGVFTVWAPAAVIAGSGLLYALVIAGLVATANALSSAQLAAVHPESGGTYVYARERLGATAGHLAGWGFVVGKTASCAAMALAVGAYLWPQYERLAGVLAVVGIVIVNLFGITRTVALTRVLLAISLTTLTLVVIAGVGSANLQWDRLDPSGASPVEVLRAAGLMFFAFAGYARLATLGEEVIEPQRTIPRAVPMALGLVLVLYAVIGVVTLGAVPLDRLTTTDAPLAEVVAVAGWDPLRPLVRVGAGIAALGVLLSLIAGVSRTALAMARRRDLPPVLATVDTRRGTPWVAEVAVGAAAIVLVVTVALRSALAISGVGVLVYYALTNASALRLSPAERRWPAWIAVAGLIGCCVLVLSLPTGALIGGLITLAGGLIVRFAQRRFTRGALP